LTLRNYAGTCGYLSPDWVHNGLAESDKTSRRYRLASQCTKCLDRDKKNPPEEQSPVEIKKPLTLIPNPTKPVKQPAISGQSNGSPLQPTVGNRN
jgi:hypothetical protein